MAQDCEPLKPIKPVDTQIRNKTEAQADTVLKSLLSGTIKNEYERIATSVAGEDIHKWDSFVYIVCTILHESQMSTKEKLQQVQILFQLKSEPPPSPPPHSEIPGIAKFAEIGSSLETMRVKYPKASRGLEDNGLLAIRYPLRIFLPKPLSHSVDVMAISYFGGDTTKITQTKWGLQHGKCGREADGRVFQSALNNWSDYHDYQSGSLNLMSNSLGSMSREESLSHDDYDMTISISAISRQACMIRLHFLWCRSIISLYH